MAEKVAIIIGAGPAGLTAAYEFLDRTDVKPVVLEMTGDIGGLARTAVYKGNRIDIGGHRFFSKSDRVMDWWQNILPLQGAPARDDRLLGRSVPVSEKAARRPLGASAAIEAAAPDPDREDLVMLVRGRLSRILFLRKFFSYPITLSLGTLRNLGLWRIWKIGWSYLRSSFFPIRSERSLEDFFVNRFGRELYNTFFRDYTEKVWGVPCDVIKPEWGAQRVKGLSIWSAIFHALKKPFQSESSISQKETETSLIERFLYPKLGPGQMWETVAEEVVLHGGEVHLHQRVAGFRHEGSRITAVETVDERTGERRWWKGDVVLSSMPLKDLAEAYGEGVPEDAAGVARGLIYRDFVTVGVLLSKLKIRNESGIRTVNDIVPDNWIYIQEPEVKIGRLQIFNNWSPYLVQDPDKVWIGVEYFCNEGDAFWSMADSDIAKLAVQELAAIEVIDAADALDSVVIRAPKTYPAYFGTYDRFDVLRAFLDGIENLYPIGRNGMHKYNNQDHSMLCAMTAVDLVASGSVAKDALWAVNTEQDYQEEK